MVEFLHLEGSEHQEVLADLFSCALDFGWETFEAATKAGTYPLILRDLHNAATGAHAAVCVVLITLLSGKDPTALTWLCPAEKLLTIDAAFALFKDRLLQHWYATAQPCPVF